MTCSSQASASKASPKVCKIVFNVGIYTLDRADWKRIDQNKLPVQDTIEALHDFRDVVTFKPMWGWRR